MRQANTFLSPSQAARVLGASESSLKRWVDAGDMTIRRTAGGHRRIPVAEVLRYARSEGLTIQDAELLGGARPAASRRLTTSVTRAVLAGDGGALQRLLLHAHFDGVTVTTLADGPIRLAMESVGRLWLDSPDGIACEHRATMLVMRAVEGLRSVLPIAPANAPVAIGGGRAGDPYLLPSMLAALVLQEVGWRTVDLGPDTPDEALVSAAKRYRAALVWRSFTGDLDPAAATKDLAALCRKLSPCRVAVGGRCADLLGNLDQIGNLLRPASMAELAALAGTGAACTWPSAPESSSAIQNRRRSLILQSV